MKKNGSVKLKNTVKLKKFIELHHKTLSDDRQFYVFSYKIMYKRTT